MRIVLDKVLKIICWTLAICLCLFISRYALWAFVCDSFRIATPSMYPTLQVGEHVVVNKLLMGARIYKDFNFDREGIELSSMRTRGLRTLRHNDIVTFNYPYHNGKVSFVINEVYCKRCVALPGDSLSIQNGAYKNNNYEGILGIESEQQRLAATPDSILHQIGFYTVPYESPMGWNIRNMGAVYIPRAGDKIKVTAKEAALYHLLLEWELGKTVSWDWNSNRACADGKELSEHTFLHNYYFMAGDNVLNSNDSRYWGLVPEDYIIGIVSHKHNENSWQLPCSIN